MLDESTLRRIAQRMKARLPGTSAMTLEVTEAGELWFRVEIGDKTHGIGPCGDTEEDIVARLAQLAADPCGLTVLPEIVLTGDTAVVLDGHQLRVAELEIGYDVRVRERADPTADYSEDEAEADVDRVSRVLEEAWKCGRDRVPRSGTGAAEWRHTSSLLLSRLHGWKRGAPPSSPGYQRARTVFETECPDADPVALAFGDEPPSTGVWMCPHCSPVDGDIRSVLYRRSGRCTAGHELFPANPALAMLAAATGPAIGTEGA